MEIAGCGSPSTSGGARPFHLGHEGSRSGTAMLHMTFTQPNFQVVDAGNFASAQSQESYMQTFVATYSMASVDNASNAGSSQIDPRACQRQVANIGTLAYQSVHSELPLPTVRAHSCFLGILSCRRRVPPDRSPNRGTSIRHSTKPGIAYRRAHLLGIFQVG